MHRIRMTYEDHHTECRMDDASIALKDTINAYAGTLTFRLNRLVRPGDIKVTNIKQESKGGN